MSHRCLDQPQLQLYQFKVFHLFISETISKNRLKTVLYGRNFASDRYACFTLLKIGGATFDLMLLLFAERPFHEH